jgi:hypothetical protein
LSNSNFSNKFKDFTVTRATALTISNMSGQEGAAAHENNDAWDSDDNIGPQLDWGDFVDQ